MAAIRSIVSCCILFVIVGLVGCGGGTPAQSTSPPDTGTLHTSAAFPDGCVATGSASARHISNPDFKLEGPNALGAAGDFLLANDRALFVISGNGPQKTYYHYGGILVDAVAIDQCEQAADEEFFEMALMLGRLNPFVQSQSSFRAFNAHRIDIINDGSNGQAAVIRATGTDDYYWLLELTLMARGVLAGKPKYLSQPFGFEMVVDYILEPDSPTLKVEYRIVNQLNGFNNLTIAFVLLSSGNGAPLHTFSSFELNVEGLDLQYGIPWVTASNGQGSYVYGTNSDVLTTTRISGVDALLDAKQLANTYLGSFLTANGTPGDTLLQEYFVTVSAGDELAAVNAHLAHTPKKIRTISTPVSGTVVDAASGSPVANAKIEFQTRKQNFLSAWPWETFISTYSDDNGFFGDDIPLLHYLDT